MDPLLALAPLAEEQPFDPPCPRVASKAAHVPSLVVLQELSSTKFLRESSLSVTTYSQSPDIGATRSKPPLFPQNNRNDQRPPVLGLKSVTRCDQADQRLWK
ncbi:hypothetical protein SRHO_G00260740 [Serrasalmus rhombeus]